MGLTTFHQAVPRDAPEKETVEFGASNAFLGDTHTNDSVKDSIAPDIIVKPSYREGVMGLGWGIHDCVTTSKVSDSLFYATIRMNYEVDSLGKFTLLALRVIFAPPSTDTAISLKVEEYLDSVRYNWNPGTINGQPVTMKDSTWYRVEFRNRK